MVKDCVQVARSVTRLHKEWIQSRFGPFEYDPDANHDILVSFDLNPGMKCGASLGAALTGEYDTCGFQWERHSIVLKICFVCYLWLAAAMVSMYLGREVRLDVAIIGEISLCGRIGGVTGFSGKIRAACQQGQRARYVLVPEDNVVTQPKKKNQVVAEWDDIVDMRQWKLALVPKRESSRLAVVSVETIFECLELCLSRRDQDNGG